MRSHLLKMLVSEPIPNSADEEDLGMDIFERGLCLPSDNKMTPDQQDRIIEAVRACFA